MDHDAALSDLRVSASVGSVLFTFGFIALLLGGGVVCLRVATTESSTVLERRYGSTVMLVVAVAGFILGAVFLVRVIAALRHRREILVIDGTRLTVQTFKRRAGVDLADIVSLDVVERSHWLILHIRTKHGELIPFFQPAGLSWSDVSDSIRYAVRHHRPERPQEPDR